MINSNWHPISYRFRYIAAYCSNFGHFAFLSHPLGLRDNVRCSSWAHWKARCGLPISDNWTFIANCYGWGARSENRWKIGDFAPTRSHWPKISGRRGRSPPTIFACIVRPINALQLCRWQFSHKDLEIHNRLYFKYKIRDLVRSRGLGDVYKRQCYGCRVFTKCDECSICIAIIAIEYLITDNVH